ncbi:hypothetical protein V8D89_007877 [Ganoderma adspersum]
MVPSTSTAEPSPPLPGVPFTRSDSVASSVQSGGLRRRSRTRTRSIALSKHGKSQEPSAVNINSRSETGESFLDFDDAPPVPKVLYDEPEGMTVEQIRAVKKARRRSRTVGAESRPRNGGLLPEMPQMARARSALDVRDPPFEQVRGRQAKSDNGSVKAAKLRGLSLPRQALRQHSPSDDSSQPSPLTPYGFGDASAVRFLTRSSNPRDSVMTQNSTASSSLYPASTSIGTRTESSMPYTDDQDEGDLSYPEIVTPDHPEFNPDDVSYRLRLLMNNSYFLPPAHTKPTPFSLSPNPTEAVKKGKPANGGFFDFFRLGKSKSKPASPIPGSPPAVDGAGPILRTTSDMPSASGILLRAQQQPLGSPTLPQPPPPASRVVVLRERMDDLATAAKEAERELRSKDARKARSQTTPRDRFVDDIIDPTDAVDLPPQMADSMFAVQTSAAYGLGPQDSLNAAVLADRLVPGSPGLWSRSSEEDSWRKDLLHQAVSHSLGNTPDHSFSSSVSSNGGRPPISPPPQSEASFPTPAMLGAQKARVGQRIVEDLSIRSIVSSDISPPVSPLSSQHVVVHTRTPSSGERSPPANEHPMLSAVGPPARAETPAHMPVPLAPAPRKQLVNPLYSLSQPDLPGSTGRHGDGFTRSSSDSYHTVPKATPSTGLSAAEEAAAEIIVSLSPPPLSGRGITPEPRGIEGMPSFTTTATRSRTESESRYSSDEMSFRTPLDTDAEVTGGRPSMTLSLPFGRPSISVSVSEFSIPSPTASAFGDAVFGSCRTPSVMSRRSIASHPSPSLHSLPELPPLPSTPRSAISPPPRVSSSVSPTELPVPPRRRALHPSPSAFDTRSLNSRSPLSSGSPAVLDIRPTPDAPADSSFSSASTSASPTVPIAARRGLGNPLSLTIPTRIRPPVIHSAPAPASPTDFFDRIPTTIQNAMDDLDTSDESDSEDGLLSSEGDKSARSGHFNPPPRSSSLAQSPQPRTARSESVETAEVFVEPRTQAISNRASSSSARPSIMRLGNHSTPQFSPASSLSASAHEPLPQYTYDRKKPIGNVVELGRRSFTSSRSPFKKGKAIGIAHLLPTSPLLPIGAMPSSPIAPGTSFAQGQPPLSPRRRPATAPEEQGKGPGAGRKIQRESIQRFDGMLVQHLAAERDRMKRITSDYLSPSSAEGSHAHLS